MSPSLALVLLVLRMMLMPMMDDALLTVAERSEYESTSTYVDVIELIDRLEAKSPHMRRAVMGRTVEDREIPLLIFADPPVATAAAAREAAAHGKPIVFVMANIHAGEVEGKEASLMLARELATTPDHPLLDDLVIVLAPIYNADGNEKFGPVDEHRPGQDGPRRVGIRPNAQGYDLNRDYVKLEAPETRALVQFLSEWDPHLTIDLHTTNGSAHRYMLTFDSPLNPSGHAAPIAYVREELLPAVQKRLLDRTGYDTCFYGNFNRDQTAWETYSALPRFGGPYQGLRGQMSVLSEAYSYATFKDRVMVTLEFVREILVHAAANRAKIIDIHDRARRETVAAGQHPQPDDVVGLRHRAAAHNQLITIKGFEKLTGGEGGAAVDPHIDHGPPKDYACLHFGRFEPTLSVRRPTAYIIPPGCGNAIDNLRAHGVEVEPFEGEADVEIYTVDRIEQVGRPFQGHTLIRLDVTARHARTTFPAGSARVRTAQPLGNLVVYLLEPQSEDGLAAWNFLDSLIAVGKDYPIVRYCGEIHPR